MAELTVQPKKKTAWPLILLALAIIGALVYFLVLRRNEATPAAPTPATTTTQPTNGTTTQ